MKNYAGIADEALALLYVEGDNSAFDELLSRNQQKLFQYILFMVRDPEVANDVFQETFVKVITKLQEGRYTNSGKFSFWLTRIAHNIIMDNYRQQKSDRIVEPALLIFQWSSWYLWGWCREKNAPRLFKLDRMDSLQVKETFSPRQMEMPDLLSEQAFPDRYHVVVRISRKSRWRLVEEYGPGCYEETPEGDCLFSTGFTDREHLLSWILSFRGDAELLEPQELREELAKIGEIIRQKHHT